MNEFTIIATWYMSLSGVVEGAKVLSNGGSADDAVENAIKVVEDSPQFKSVGYGGLPNEKGIVELDAAFMDGDNLNFGAIGSIRDYKNPISIARKLSNEKNCNFLVGVGAEEYAHMHGFQRQNMLTPETKEKWLKTLEEGKKDLTAYKGHDTVCVIAIDTNGRIIVGTSTSGLFMKKSGRIGDSPIPGSGFYADSQVGAATATGVGEDIMKGCLSYETVRRMSQGLSPKEAADSCMKEFVEKLKTRNGKETSMSVICANKHGEIGVATTVEFPFVVAKSSQKPTVYLSHGGADGTTYSQATEEWLLNATTD